MTNLKRLNLLYENLVISPCQYKKTGPGYKRRRLYMSGAYMRDYRVNTFFVSIRLLLKILRFPSMQNEPRHDSYKIHIFEGF